MFEKLAIGLFGLVLVICSGCRSVHPWGDLHTPRLWEASDAPPIEVVTSNRVLSIVTDGAAENKWAAMFLAQTLEEMTTRKVEVYVEYPGQAGLPSEGLLIGSVSANAGWNCELSKENDEAFRVVARNGSVRFLGRADYAVFDWCERVLGLRCYPGFGKSVLMLPRIVVPATDYSDAPVFSCRRLSGGSDGAWLRVAKSSGSRQFGVNVHQPRNWVKDTALKAAHPRIFEDGESPMLCYGNPETLEYYRSRIDRHISGAEDSGGIVDTERKVVTVCQWDAPIACQCAHCRELADPSLGEEGVSSPVIWGQFLVGLADWLKETHPDYRIVILPYQNSRRVPDGLKDRLRRLNNVEAQVTTMSGLAMLKNPSCRAWEESLIRDWHEATGRKIVNWHYSCWPQDWTAAPYVFGKLIKRHYEDAVNNSVGSLVCGSDEDPRMFLSLYVWMRCLWNPDVDVEAIYDEFALRVFGSAAEPMRRLIDLQESCWNRPWPDDACSYRNVFEISYTCQDVQRMKELVREAEDLAIRSEDAVALQGVRAYARAFEEFVAESEILTAGKGRQVVYPGERHEMVAARSALMPRPWAGTSVETHVEVEELVLRVVCEEPAAASMDFSRTVKDAVWGNDCVTFVVANGENVRSATVDLTGGVSGGWKGFSAMVVHDGGSWSVIARIRLTPAEIAAGFLVGNVARWRVGDRRRPVKERVAGSRFEQSRLRTCFTNLNADPAAFVSFSLRERTDPK